MAPFDARHPCVVLGMYETGLGVGRSLARSGLDVTGLDFKRDIGFRSRFIKTDICPHPIRQEKEFLDFMVSLSRKYSYSPVLFLTADEFVLSISRLRDKLSDHFLFNLPPSNLIECIMQKDCLYVKARDAGIPIPKTILVERMQDIAEIRFDIKFPAFIKGRFSYFWRKRFGGTKGFLVHDENELIDKVRGLAAKGIAVLVQEYIRGPDTNNFKSCYYFSRNGELLLEFTLQKIRQQPVGFGIGASVRSVRYPQLTLLGRRFFSAMNYRGVGSAEFKLDERDDILKLIELNPRYWQQNALADKCGMSFPIIDYLETTDQEPKAILTFLCNVKWINICMDLNAFLSHRKKSVIEILKWLASLKGVKIFSDFSWDDFLPAVMDAKYRRLFVRYMRWICGKVIPLKRVA